MDEILKSYKDFLKQKRYSENMQQEYCKYFRDFCDYSCFEYLQVFRGLEYQRIDD